MPPPRIAQASQVVLQEGTTTRFLRILAYPVHASMVPHGQLPRCGAFAMPPSPSWWSLGVVPDCQVPKVHTVVCLRGDPYDLRTVPVDHNETP